MDVPTPDPPKRKRGRPRKTPPPPVEPEEIIFAAPEPASEPGAPDEEVIHLPRDPEPEPEPAPAPSPMEVRAEPEPAVVYLQPAVDEAKERARRNTALTKVKRYRESFPAVKAMPFDESWSTSAIESHLEDIRIMVSSRTTGLIVKSAYVMGVKGLEVGTTMAGMKTYGLADLLSKNAEIDEILKELQAEMGVGSIPPAQRLALATMSMVFVLDSANRKSEALAGFKKENVNVQLKERYNDL